MSTYKKDNVQALKLNNENKTKNILAMPLLNSSLVVVINKVQKFHQKRFLTFYTLFLLDQLRTSSHTSRRRYCFNMNDK